MRVRVEQTGVGGCGFGTVGDREQKGFQPSGARFRLGRENDVLIMRLEVLLEGDYVGNNC